MYIICVGRREQNRLAVCLCTRLLLFKFGAAQSSSVSTGEIVFVLGQNMPPFFGGGCLVYNGDTSSAYARNVMASTAVCEGRGCLPGRCGIRRESGRML